MHPICRILPVLMLLLFFTKAWTQKPALRNYTVDDGLPGSETYHVIQDKKGYLWISTSMGVSRFDGSTFRNFDVQSGLPENTVFEIFEDETGKVWFLSYPFQLSYFSFDTICHYKYNHILKTIAGQGLVPAKTSFMADLDGNVIFSLLRNENLYKIDRNGKTEIINESHDGTQYSIIISEIDGRLFVTDHDPRKNNNTILFKTHNGIFPVTINELYQKVSDRFIMALKTSSNDLIISHNHYISHIKTDGSIHTFDVKDRVIWISFDAEGFLWVGKHLRGIEKYSLDHLMKGPLEIYLDGKSVSSVFTDNEGGLWFSTLDAGLFYLPSKAFVSYGTGDGLSGSNIYALELFQGKVFLGSNSNSLDVLENGIIRTVEKLGAENKTIRVLKAFENRVLWIGSETFLLSYANNTIKPFYKKYKSLENVTVPMGRAFSIKDIYPLGGKDVLIGQIQSLSRFLDGYIVYDSYADDKIQMRVECIAQESDSSFLIGTFNGLWRFTGSSLNHLGTVNDLLKNRITDILKLKDGQSHVLGTKGQGILIMQQDSVIQITRDNGLSSNSVTSLLQTGDTLWAATNFGLNMMFVSELSNITSGITVFRKEHGLVSNEINRIKSDGVCIYIATNEGLTVFDRKLYSPRMYPPPVYIEKVNIMSQDTIVKDHYELNYDQNFITISFAGISFRDAARLKYKYRLLGLNDHWITTDNLQVEYAFLPPGKYRFEVMAINSDSMMSLEPAFISFTIQNPFWMNIWFIVFFIVFVASILTGYFYFRVQRLKKEHYLKNNIYLYRQQALTRLMNPHFVFNSLNSIQLFILKKDNLASAQYLSKFAKLFRIILNQSYKQTISLSDEIEALSLYMELESMRFTHKFAFSINIEKAIQPESYYIPPFLIQPLVENAIWHGIMTLEKPGVINVDFKKYDREMICTVTDNGIGRKRSMEMKYGIAEKESRGISIIKARLELLNSYLGVDMKIIITDLFNPDNTPSGTKVTINFPNLGLRSQKELFVFETIDEDYR